MAHPKTLFRERREPSRRDDVHLTPSQHHGVLPQAEYMRRTGSKVVLNLAAPDNMKHVEPNDFIAHLRSFQGGIEKSSLRGKVSTAYTVISPLPEADPGFYRWALKSGAFISELAANCEQLRDGQSVKFGDFVRIRLPHPPLEEQRRIADFLDDRVARIDQIIAARRAQIGQVLAERDAAWNELDEELCADSPLVPIRRFLISIADGPFGSSLTSGHYADSGARVIRLGNVGINEFRNEDAAYIDEAYAADLSAHAVKSGDLIMAGLGDDRWPLGRCAVVPGDLGPAIVKADCYRIRLDERVAHSFAAAFLSGPRSRAALRLLSRGSTRARLNTDVAREAEIPAVDRAKQDSYSAAVSATQAQATLKANNLQKSIDLLSEYKHSLITAAVSGELDVSTAGSGIPG